MNTTVKTLLDRGLLRHSAAGYLFLDQKHHSKTDLIKATMWLMEEVAKGQLQVVADRSNVPMWIEPEGNQS